MRNHKSEQGTRSGAWDLPPFPFREGTSAECFLLIGVLWHCDFEGNGLMVRVKEITSTFIFQLFQFNNSFLSSIKKKDQMSLSCS